jgi:hypothetical protein
MRVMREGREKSDERVMIWLQGNDKGDKKVTIKGDVGVIGQVSKR